MVAKQSPARGPYSRHITPANKASIGDTRSSRYRNGNPFRLYPTSSDACPYSLCSTRFFARATALYRVRTRPTIHAHTNNSGPQHAHHGPQPSSSISGNNKAKIRPSDFNTMVSPAAWAFGVKAGPPVIVTDLATPEQQLTSSNAAEPTQTHERRYDTTSAAIIEPAHHQKLRPPLGCKLVRLVGAPPGCVTRLSRTRRQVD